MMVPNFAWAKDNWLTVKVTGASGRLTKNIQAHLGNNPDSEVQRRAYLFTVEDNVNAALESIGHYHAKVSINVEEATKGPWKLNIDIDEGAPTIVQWIDIKFSEQMIEDNSFNRWLDQLTIKPGDVLDHGVYQELKNQLVTLAMARGYFDGKFSRAEVVVNRDVNTAKIHLHYDSGRRYQLGNVEFHGHTLNDEFMKKLIPFKPNSNYSTRRLNRLNRNLIDTGYFSNIKVLPQVDAMTDVDVPIRVDLSPRPTHSFELGLGADIGTNAEKTIEPRVRLTWRMPQINSYGHTQETTMEWSPDRPKFLTTYTIPLKHPLDDQLQFKIGLLRDKYGVTQDYNEEDRSYDYTGQLESEKRLLGVIRQQTLADQWLFGYSLEYSQELYNQSNIDYDSKFLLAGFGIGKTVRGDNTLDPKSGYRHIYSMQYGDPNLGSEIRLLKFEANFKWIDTFFDRHRFVARLDLGANIADSDDIAQISPSLRYFTGGDQSIRGYGYQELGPFIEYTNEDGSTSRQVVGGRYLMVGSLEYQFYLTDTWRLASFVDAGNAFDTETFEPIASVGGGVHWISPIGPIRFDLGVGLKETETVDRSWRIHLTMGTDL
ncbi:MULTISPECIES: autotransporter assembly complex family protein [unclassified Shewanella]|uniref:autotransporter assembly complex protein TamA n=1 Tax=unclassified Shewanella TaxID=196818 RepID=UPI000C85D376|nr:MULTISPECIES: autotransporter assembly complex family protein [unclassified Shewanella]MDO6678228.1 autotransporter assembly complex family protein [Shewanella sp. 4_MG-2023]